MAGSCEPLATSEPNANTRPLPETTSTVSRALSSESAGNSSLNPFWSCSHCRTVYVLLPALAPVASFTVTRTWQVPVPVVSTNPKL